MSWFELLPEVKKFAPVETETDKLHFSTENFDTLT